MTRPYKAKITTEEERIINIKIGKNLKEARINRLIHSADGTPPRRKFCSQVELAKAINVAFQQIGKYEKGINGLSIFRLIKISNYLDVEPQEILLIAENNSVHAVHDNGLKISERYEFQDIKQNKKLVGQYEPPINSSDKDRDCSLSSEL